MTKLAFLSLAVLTFGAFAAEPKIPAESQAVLFLDPLVRLGVLQFSRGVSHNQFLHFDLLLMLI